MRRLWCVHLGLLFLLWQVLHLLLLGRKRLTLVLLGGRLLGRVLLGYLLLGRGLLGGWLLGGRWRLQCGRLLGCGCVTKAQAAPCQAAGDQRPLCGGRGGCTHRLSPRTRQRLKGQPTSSRRCADSSSSGRSRRWRGERRCTPLHPTWPGSCTGDHIWNLAWPDAAAIPTAADTAAVAATIACSAVEVLPTPRRRSTRTRPGSHHILVSRL